ncbi:MAG: hypothetical protein HY908_22370 [Myxococcales bacterium]|nr:hypothetical protein [Myxococcales bacterium]
MDRRRSPRQLTVGASGSALDVPYRTMRTARIGTSRGGKTRLERPAHAWAMRTGSREPDRLRLVHSSGVSEARDEPEARAGGFSGELTDPHGARWCKVGDRCP